MKNQFTLLQKENNLRMKCLKSKNQIMLEKWITYAKASDINPYDYELCRKELIGISLQKELENKDLEHFFGEEPKYITENIIQGCKKKTWKDYLLFDIRAYLGSATIVYPLFGFLCVGLFDPLSVFDVLTHIIYFLLIIAFNMLITNVHIRTKLNHENLKPNGLLQTIVYLFFCLLSIAIFWSFRPFINITIPGCSPLTLSVLYGILWLILTYFWQKYVQQLVSERPWQG